MSAATDSLLPTPPPAARVSPLTFTLAVYLALTAAPKLYRQGFDRIYDLVLRRGWRRPFDYFDFGWELSLDVSSAAALAIFAFALLLPFARAARHGLAASAFLLLVAQLSQVGQHAKIEWSYHMPSSPGLAGSQAIWVLTYQLTTSLVLAAAIALLLIENRQSRPRTAPAVQPPPGELWYGQEPSPSCRWWKFPTWLAVAIALSAAAHVLADRAFSTRPLFVAPPNLAATVTAVLLCLPIPLLAKFHPRTTTLLLAVAAAFSNARDLETYTRLLDRNPASLFLALTENFTPAAFLLALATLGPRRP